MRAIARDILAGLTAILLALAAPALGGQQARAAIHLEPVVSGFTQPIHVTSARDGTNRLFIVEQEGLIKVLQPGATTPTLFLNLVTPVLLAGERGLLGLAFHPGFDANRRFFVFYTRKPDGALVIAEYRASVQNPNVADTAEKPILVIPHPVGNHNGGMIAFGPDGFLYIGTGDGGGGNDPDNNAQNLQVLLGKILRIDVDTPNGTIPYSSPSTNPFFDSPPARPEIFAFGFRNPWRFSFDRVSGELIVGDVGQGTREEIDVVMIGGNYGWRVREGRVCTTNDPSLCDDPSFIPPVLDYGHKNGRCSVTGGYAYRGTLGTLPPGTYVFADYCTGEIWSRAGSGRTLLLDTGMFVSSFGEDEAGEILVVDHSAGAVHRLAGESACTYAITPTAATVPAGRRSATVSVTTDAACAWSAASNDAWITVTSGVEGTGNGTVTYSVAANSGAARSGSLSIAGRTFSVSQAAHPLACFPSLNPVFAIAPRSGSSGSVAVALAAGCNWTAVSNVPWITITGGGSGSGNGTVTYSVAPGNGFRSGSLTIAGRTVHVFSF